MKIIKQEVEHALEQMELKLFGRIQTDNPDRPNVIRMINVFAEAYYKNYYPLESVILRDSYTLLQSEGYYYTDEV